VVNRQIETVQFIIKLMDVLGVTKENKLNILTQPDNSHNSIATYLVNLPVHGPQEEDSR
jgi:hypothetical protein